MEFVPKARLGLRPDEGKQVKGSSNASVLPYVIEPPSDKETDRDVKTLIGWLTKNKSEIQERIQETGGILFRGFNVRSAQDFEDIAQSITVEPLKDGYLGTSPRKRLTQYVFTASEFPSFFPIPQHLEMSFLPNSIPKMIFFCCLEPVGKKDQGETPITDMRKVWADLDPKVKEKFEKKEILNIRNYSGGESGVLARLDPFRTKPWDTIFETTNRDTIKEMCEVDNVDVIWKGKNKADLELANKHPAFRVHPKAGTKAWANHSQVFHIDSIPAEYSRVAARQGRLILWLLYLLTTFIIFLKKLLVSPRDQAMHCQYGTGEEIPAKEMEAARAAIWKNSVFFNWRKGDVMVLDNFSISHGRMPYEGSKRLVVTCFS